MMWCFFNSLEQVKWHLIFQAPHVHISNVSDFYLWNSTCRSSLVDSPLQLTPVELSLVVRGLGRPCQIPDTEVTEPFLWSFECMFWIVVLSRNPTKSQLSLFAKDSQQFSVPLEEKQLVSYLPARIRFFFSPNSF